jgi:type II secretory pathway pseudopilin PulG
MSKPQRPKRRIAGFSLLEVVIATAVLVIGVSSLAALSATMIGRGRQSKYAALAGTLASEKLEDLNRWQAAFNPPFSSSTTGIDVSDNQICVPAGSTSEGSLVPSVNPFPSSVTINCTGTSEAVNYYDLVVVDITNATNCPNPTDGCFAETYSGLNSSGTAGYLTTYHSPDGTIPGFPAGTPAGTTAGGPVWSTNQPSYITFERNWVIELNPTVNGVQLLNMRRITVRVTLLDQSVTPGVTFQMSTVRP